MNTKHLTGLMIMVLILTAVMPCAMAATANYEHDPRLCADLMEDIVYNPDAVYGYSPNPESTRLSAYAQADWTDEALVEKARQERIAYHESYAAMYELLESMTAENKSAEEIARAVSAMRNQIRLDAYKDDPENLELLKQSNLETYGSEKGPTADSLFEKYGSWEAVTLKAFSSNAGMDACLGLYDEQYEHNLLTGAIAPADSAVYTVKKNDYLVKIAQQYLGSDRAWSKIFAANAGKIKQAYIIYEGQQLVIPLG